MKVVLTMTRLTNKARNVYTRISLLTDLFHSTSGATSSVFVVLFVPVFSLQVCDLLVVHPQNWSWAGVLSFPLSVMNEFRVSLITLIVCEFRLNSCWN
jgi:hypothetical protein